MHDFNVLSPERRRLARIMADILDARADHHASKTVWIPDQNFIAFRGEQLVLTAFRDKHVEYRPLLNGAGDQGDILLHLKNGLSLMADVKTASKKTHQFLFVPRVQTAHKILPLYISLRMQDGWSGTIDGYCHPEELEVGTEEDDYPLSDPGILWVDRADLIPFHFLYDMVADGQPLEVYPPEVLAAFRQTKETTSVE